MIEENDINIDGSLDREYVISCMQLVLNKCHTHSDKKILDSFKEDRLNMACPICGDSHDRTRLKRGWLFLNSLTYKCYNDGCRSTFTQLCELGGVQLDPQKKLQLMQHASNNVRLKPKEDEFQSIVNSELISLKKVSEVFNSGMGKITEFKPIQEGSRAHNYLLLRKITDHTHIYEGNLWVTNKWSEYCVIFLNRRGDNVLGLQTRNLKDSKEKRHFHIMNFGDLLKEVEPERTMAEEEINFLNKLSYFFNILNVDFERIVTLFEGFTDSVFYPNSMGMVGLNTDYNFLLDNDVDLQFFFDNDEIGKRKTLHNVEKNMKSFLWKKLLQDIANKQKDPKIAFDSLNSKIKDLNKLAIFFDNPYDSLQLPKYFSKDSFDKIYIQVERYSEKSKKDFKNKNFKNSFKKN